MIITQCGPLFIQCAGFLSVESRNEMTMHNISDAIIPNLVHTEIEIHLVIFKI
jgi:hypothetical protein